MSVILHKGKNFQRYHHPWLHDVLQNYSTKNHMVWNKNREVDQWNQISYSDINQHNNVLLNIEARNKQWKKRKHLQEMVLVFLDASM